MKDDIIGRMLSEYYDKYGNQSSKDKDSNSNLTTIGKYSMNIYLHKRRLRENIRKIRKNLERNVFFQMIKHMPELPENTSVDVDVFSTCTVYQAQRKNMDKHDTAKSFVVDEYNFSFYPEGIGIGKLRENIIEKPYEDVNKYIMALLIKKNITNHLKRIVLPIECFEIKRNFELYLRKMIEKPYEGNLYFAKTYYRKLPDFVEMTTLDKSFVEEGREIWENYQKMLDEKWRITSSKKSHTMQNA